MTIYFLGIGGIGMSAIAHYYLQNGDTVHGYDHTRSAITDKLQDEGAFIHFDEDVNMIPPQVDFVVYTPAIPASHKELTYFQEHHIPIYKRSQVLGKIAKGHPTIAVAGTHGKTTTTAMITQLMAADRKLLAFIGGIAKNFESNIIIQNNFDTVVAEADEFDRSFLTLFPTLAIITSIDSDHLDIYGDYQHLVESFQLFANQIEEEGHLLIHERIASAIHHPNKLTYGEGENCDFRISDIHLEANDTSFTLSYRDLTYEHLQLTVSGMHNILNAAAAVASGILFGISEATIRERIAAFSGVKRRFDYQIKREDLVFIDDYAHHPEEIRAILTAIRKLYPEKQLTVIFQPHLYTRTRDFAPQFAEVLALADRLILLDIYPARELPIPGINSQFLLDMVDSPHKILLSKEALLPYLTTHKPQLLLTIGAGDIDRLVAPIRELLEK